VRRGRADIDPDAAQRESLARDAAVVVGIVLVRVPVVPRPGGVRVQLGPARRGP
jgi:hypothetical protein